MVYILLTILEGNYFTVLLTHPSGVETDIVSKQNKLDRPKRYVKFLVIVNFKMSLLHGKYFRLRVFYQPIVQY